MHRVSSTFEDRLPSHGLLLLRVILATTLIARCVQLNGASLQTIAPHVIAAVAGLFLLFGLWTPLAGAVVAIVELFIAVSHNHDPLLSLLLASVAVALALLGAGNWSVDARRSGWKRIVIGRPDN
jgi:putative oxidoreductase